MLPLTKTEALDVAISMLDLIKSTGNVAPLTMDAFNERLDAIKAARHVRKPKVAPEDRRVRLNTSKHSGG